MTKNKGKAKAKSSSNLQLRSAAGSSTSPPRTSTSHSTAADASSKPAASLSTMTDNTKADNTDSIIPNSEISLCCVVDGRSTTFSVDILSTKTVDHLKQRICTPARFPNTAPEYLTLWKVSIPVTDEDDGSDDDTDGPPIDLGNIPSDDKKKLKATRYLADVFKETPPEKTIHIIVQPPPQDAATGRQTLSDAFPDGLPYKPPGPLLKTMGSNWTYQPDPTLFELLRRNIKEHSKEFDRGRGDKTTVPLYLFLCGAGTGKSRNAQEFHQSAVACLSAKEDLELKKRVEDSWVFHVSLENGTSPLPAEATPLEVVCNRMLLQLLPEERIHGIADRYNVVDPMDVVKLLAKHHGQDWKSASVILVVDGLQSFMTDSQDGHNKDSFFSKALTNIADLAVGEIFLMVCCTATATSPVDQALASTHRNRVVLPVASLDPPHFIQRGKSKPVFDENDQVVKVLVSDCGGHGRALETLQQAIEEVGGNKYNVDLLMQGLRVKLENRYLEVLLNLSSTIDAMARVILTRAYLDPNEPVPGTNKLPGELAIAGLVRYVQPNGLGTGGYLTAPYIWLWLFSSRSRTDPLLLKWRFCDYGDLMSKHDADSLPGFQFWQHFECFVAAFRCFKSKVLDDGSPTSIGEVHTGARLNGDIEFTNHHLKLAFSSHHVNTKSTSNELRQVANLRCEHETLDFRRSEHCIVNAPSAPFGDSFIRLDTKPFRTEVHQCKRIADGTMIDFKVEREKAASSTDFFMLFTTRDLLDIELPPLSGIVDRSNWDHYFGPFAGRAFVFATAGPLDINRATRADLKRMTGAEGKKADLIMEERGKRKFDSYEDARRRFKGRGVGETVLKRFKYPDMNE